MSQAYPERPASTYSLAIVSLVLSILGFTPVLPLVGSIAGIVTGYIARREIAARPHHLTGDGLARAGIILGWIGLALVLIAVVGLILFLVPFSFTTIQTIETSIPQVITVVPQVVP